MNPISFVSQLMPQRFQNLPQDAAGVGNIRGVPLGELEKAVKGGGVKGTTETSFDNVLGRMVEEVNSKQVEAGKQVQDMLGGGNVSLNQAMITMEEASVSFQLMVEVRNKLLEAYQEIMRMQV